MKEAIKTMKAGKLEVYVFETREEMARAAYRRYVDRAGRYMAEKGMVRAIFAAAHSQDEFLADLAADKVLDFSRIEAFHMDEYFGLAAVSGNLSANLLGLGNAATPLGIRAARRMALGSQGTADNELCRLVVLNTASVQLLPTTVAAVRAGCGSAAPFDILPAVWVSSVLSVTAGLLTARLLERVVR